MKPSKVFKVGDKVFAKVKGYPAWPAKVVSEPDKNDKAKRYGVMFYATGERGNIKGEDLFYYTKNKDKYPKVMKRKDYNDAIDQIEADILKDGSDGCTDNVSDADVSHSSLNESQEPKKTGRASKSSSDEPVESKKRHLSNVGSEENVDNESDAGSSAELVAKPTKIKKLSESRKSTASKAVEPETVEVVDKVEVKQTVPLVSPDLLEGLVAYAEHVRKNEALYKEKLIDARQYTYQIIPVKLPSQKHMIGLKYNEGEAPDCKTEFEMAQIEGQRAKDLLQIKEALENGSKTPEDYADLIDKDVQLDEMDVQAVLIKEAMERHKRILERLKTEASFVTLDGKIKACLALDKAQPKEALEHLEAMLKLKVEPLTLKKHPHVVDTVRRLRRYIGNVKEWNMTPEDLENFKSVAEKIRSKAQEQFSKFEKCFPVANPADFWDEYNQQVKEFAKQCTNLTEQEIFSLRFEPNSQKAFLDLYEQQEQRSEQESNKNA